MRGVMKGVPSTPLASPGTGHAVRFTVLTDLSPIILLMRTTIHTVLRLAI